MFRYDEETHVERVADGRYEGQLVPEWNIGDNPNGGYLISIVMNALNDALPHPDPVTVTTHYLRPGVANAPCEVQVDVIRTGRSLSTARATLVQEGKPRLEVLASFGDLSQSVGVSHELTLPAPSIPDPDSCPQREGNLQGIELPISQRLDVRLHPELAVPGESGRAEMAGWIRFADGRDPDTRSLLLFCDAFPPSPLGKLGLVGWVPTVELTVHVRRRPAPGWIQSRFVTEDLQNGRMIESGAQWDSEGQLVSQNRQIGLVMQAD